MHHDSDAMPAANLTSRGERIPLSGDLTVKTARGLFDQTPPFQRGPVTIDLAAVRETDSAGLALLVHWRHLAAAASSQAAFINAPTQLRQMARIFQLEDMFG